MEEASAEGTGGSRGGRLLMDPVMGGVADGGTATVADAEDSRPLLLLLPLLLSPPAPAAASVLTQLSLTSCWQTPWHLEDCQQ